MIPIITLTLIAVILVAVVFSQSNKISQLKLLNSDNLKVYKSLEAEVKTNIRLTTDAKVSAERAIAEKNNISIRMEQTQREVEKLSEVSNENRNLKRENADCIKTIATKDAEIDSKEKKIADMKITHANEIQKITMELNGKIQAITSDYELKLTDKSKQIETLTTKKRTPKSI